MNTDTLQPVAGPRNHHQEAARAYLSQGWWPVPLHPPVPGDDRTGKNPIPNGWPNLRLTYAQAAETWAGDNPPNIGVVCGDPSKLVVLDFDNPDAFNAWAAAHPEAVQTRTVARDNAPAGRCHLYFSLAEGQAAPPSMKGPAGELLSTGHQVVAPPSRHYSGGTYRVANNAPVLPWKPEYTPVAATAGTAAGPRRPPGGELARNTTAGPGEGHAARGETAYAHAALASEVQAVAGTPAGQRNDRLNVAALKCGQLVAAGLLSTPEVEGALLDAARAAGLPEREARATLASGLRKGKTEPRAVPPSAPRRGGGAPVFTTPDPPADPPEPWTEPAPLAGAAGELPPLPWEALPEPLRSMAQAVARTVGVHESMAAAGALGCASIALGNRVALAIKPDHVVCGNQYWLCAVPVGEGKTPCVRPMLVPLQEWEAEQKPGYRRALDEWKAAQAVALARKAVLTRDVQAAAKGGEDTRDLKHQLARLESECEAEPPAEPRLYAEDCTSEALGRRLVGNAERMGVVSSEARRVLQIALGKYSAQGADLGLWLAGHAGDHCRVDRQGRPPYDLRAPRLSALLFTQPDALQAIGQDPEARACGFLARFLYVCPPPRAAGEYPRDSVSDGTAADYRRAIRGILELPAASDPDGNPLPLAAKFHPDAFELWWEFHRGWTAELNEVAGTGGTFLAEWLGKLREAAARMALLFATVEAVADGGPWPQPLCVTLGHVAAAGRLCEYLKVHAIRAAGVIGESQEVANARRVWAWITANRGVLLARRQAEGCGPLTAVKARDVLRAGLPGCDPTEAAVAVLRALENRGYLQPVLWFRPGSQARPHELWYVHPTAGADHGH